MKNAVWTFLMAVPALFAWTAPSHAGHPCTGGFGAGGFCTGLFAGIHSHGPLYNYGPYPYGYGSDAHGAGGCGDDGCGMPWKNGCGLFNWKCWGGLFHGCGGHGCDSGCNECGGHGHGFKLNLGHGWIKGKLHGKHGGDCGCESGCSTGGCSTGGCSTGGCAGSAPIAAPAPAPAPAPAHAAPLPAAMYGQPYPQMAYGSYYTPAMNMPAYGSVTAYGYAPAPSYQPRPQIMPVGYPSYGSYYMGR